MSHFHEAPGYVCNFRHSISDGELNHRFLVEEDGLNIVEQVSIRRKPLFWQLHTAPDHVVLVMNLDGAWVATNQRDINVLTPRSGWLIREDQHLSALLSRGAHEQLIVSCHLDLLTGFTRGAGESVSDLMLVNCPPSSFYGEVFDMLSYWCQLYQSTNLPKLAGAAAILAAQALQNQYSVALTKSADDTYAEPIIQLMNLIRRSPTSEWNLTSAAEQVGYSSYHLSRTFKSTVGMGLPEYVERCRTEKALAIVTTKNVSLEEIALTCGFSSSHNLRDAFRSNLGLLPSEIRSFNMEPIVARA